MHELSVAQSLLEIVRQHVPAEDLSDVRVVRLKVGALSGVVADSLEFAFTALTTETPLDAARLDIEHIPYSIRCSRCGMVTSPDIGISLCPSCGSDATQTVSGTELQITEVELADHQERPG